MPGAGSPTTPGGASGCCGSPSGGRAARVAGLLRRRSTTSGSLSVTVVLYVCTAGVIPISEAALAHRVSSGGTPRRRALRPGSRLGIGRLHRRRRGERLRAAGVGLGGFPVMVCGLLALLLGACCACRRSTEPAHAPSDVTSALSVLRQPVVAWFFAGVFLTVLAHTSLYAFYSLYLASLGYSNGEVGLLWGIGVIVEVIWFYFQGRWQHRLSMHGWLIVAALASALRFALIAAFGAWAGVLAVAQCLHALSFAAQHSACIAVITRHFPGRLRGRGPGALHRARLWCVGGDRRGGRRRDERDPGPQLGLLGGERRGTGGRVVLPARPAQRACDSMTGARAFDPAPSSNTGRMARSLQRSVAELSLLVNEHLPPPAAIPGPPAADARCRGVPGVAAGRPPHAALVLPGPVTRGELAHQRALGLDLGGRQGPRGRAPEGAVRPRGARRAPRRDRPLHARREAAAAHRQLSADARAARQRRRWQGAGAGVQIPGGPVQVGAHEVRRRRRSGRRRWCSCTT